MTIVKLKGCIHVHDGTQFVRLNRSNVERAMTAKGKRTELKGKPFTTAEMLASLQFDAEGKAI